MSSGKPKYYGSLISLSVAGTTISLSFGLFVPYLPLYAQLLGAVVGLQIGLITASSMITRFAFSIPSGTLSDRVGRRKTLVIGIVIFTFGTVLHPVAIDWVQLLFARGVQGIGMAMFWPSALALIADLVPPGERGRAMGFYNMLSMTGMVGGPALGGALQAYGYNVLKVPLVESFRFPFYVGAAVGVISTFVAVRYVKEGPRRPKHNPNNPHNPVAQSVALRPEFKRTLHLLMLMQFALGFGFSFLPAIVVYFSQQQYHLSMTETTAAMSIAFLASGLANMAIQMPAGKLADRMARRKLLLFSATASGAVTIAMPHSVDVTEIILFMALRSGFMAFMMPSLISLIEDLIPRAVRGKYNGLVDTSMSAGTIAGPMVGFWLYDNLGRALPFYLGAILAAVTAFIFAAFAREPTKEEAQA